MEKRIKLERKDFEEVRDKISVFPAAPAADTVEKPIPSIKETEVGEVEQDKKGNEIPKEPELENACLFCTIAQGKAQSFQIDENKDNVAILELNPISKGHALVIPKNHVDTTSLPANSFTLAKKIAKKIKTKYKPQDVKINPTSVNNHALIELIPIYEGTDVSKREQADQSELATIQKQLMVKKSTGSTAKKKTESTKTTSPGQKKKRTFNLSKRPKFPDLPQYGPRIP